MRDYIPQQNIYLHLYTVYILVRNIFISLYILYKIGLKFSRRYFSRYKLKGKELSSLSNSALNK